MYVDLHIHMYVYDCLAIAVHYSCEEVCPISDSVPLSKIFDHHGGALMIEDHDVNITVPELAVSKGETVEVQAVASLVGPYKLPDDCDPVSVFVWIAADYVFKQPVKITMPHFASLEQLNDLVVLTANTSNHVHSESGDLVLQMYRSEYEHHEVKSDYCECYTDHFCSKCLARSRSLIFKLLNTVTPSLPNEESHCSRTKITVFFCVPDDYATTDELLIELCICYSLKHCLQVRM